MPGGLRPEPGSFRDPHNRIFYRDGEVLRAISSEGLADWEALASSRLFETLQAEGKLVATTAVDGDPAATGAIDGAEGFESAALLRHERIPFVSYPYEWPFGMLKDAALLQLELLRAALQEEMVLKDSSPYNVQWRGSRPLFVDVGSFERLRPGEPWVGYRQFCMLYLYPLLLQARKGVAYQPWLRGSLDGITAEECRRLFSPLALLRRGMFSHVYLHSRLERRHGDRREDVKGELRRAGFSKEIIDANAKGLERLVGKLDWRPAKSVWTEYGSANSYSDAAAERKAAFVREATGSRRWRLVWDIGCNDGRYSRIAAESADQVVAIDADHGAVEQLYQSLKGEGDERILALTMNVTDPSPNRGWRGLERKGLPERGRPDLVLCLALVHHVVIAGNVGMGAFVDWLRELGAALVIEFPTRDDPMVKRLLAAKRDGSHPDYDQGHFERCLAEAFTVERSETLEPATRVLYFARPRAGRRDGSQERGARLEAGSGAGRGA